MPEPSLLDRIPPQNPDAERGVLGAMLLDPDAANAAAEILTAEDFYPRRHRIIYEAILELSDAGRPTDVLVCEEALRLAGRLEESGGAEYLRDLLAAVPSAANAEYYAQLVKESAVKRHLIQTCTRVIQQAYDGSAAPVDLLDEAERGIFAISEAHAQRDYAPVKAVIQKVLDSLERLHGQENALTGMATDYSDLDRLTGGFRDGELIVLGGRPSCGKTTLALNIALRAALKGLPVGVFSLEMTHEQLVRNMLSMQSRVSFHKEDGLYLQDEEWARVMEEAGELAKSPVFVDDSDHLPVQVLRARARRLKHTEKIRLVIVDYLQLVRGPAKAENRQQEIAEISRSLKGLAKELSCPVLALSQLSRDVEKTGRRPSMADLRESGAIEQDADVILLLSREESAEEAAESGSADVAGQSVLMHLDVAKNRNGRCGPVKLQFQMDKLRFESVLFGADATF
jgi:replicative DNA helicase